MFYMLLKNLLHTYFGMLIVDGNRYDLIIAFTIIALTLYLICQF